MTNPNWLVRCYSEDDEVTDSFVIQERTEIQAVREAESDPRVLDSTDWTMTKTKRRN